MNKIDNIKHKIKLLKKELAIELAKQQLVQMKKLNIKNKYMNEEATEVVTPDSTPEPETEVI